MEPASPPTHSPILPQREATQPRAKKRGRERKGHMWQLMRSSACCHEMPSQAFLPPRPARQKPNLSEEGGSSRLLSGDLQGNASHTCLPLRRQQGLQAPNDPLEVKGLETLEEGQFLDQDPSKKTEDSCKGAGGRASWHQLAMERIF